MIILTKKSYSKDYILKILSSQHFYPKYYEIPAAVVLNNRHVKREVTSGIAHVKEGSLRIKVFYHKSVNALKRHDRDRIRKVVS